MGIWLKASLVLIVIFCLFLIVNFRLEYDSISEHDKELSSKIAEISASIEEKKDRLETPFDSEYMKDYANKYLDLYSPDVVIFFSGLPQ